MSKGKLIVLEGLDGSGKATQAKLLAAHLKEQGFSVREITFPNYESDSSALVKMYLAGQFGQHPDDVNAYAASSFYAVDRYASYKKDWGSFYENGGIVIADRYTTSNAVHQASKEPPERRRQRDRMRTRPCSVSANTPSIWSASRIRSMWATASISVKDWKKPPRASILRQKFMTCWPTTARW